MYEEIETNNKRWFDLTPLLNEEFRDIEGYEGLYQVSNYGRVKSLKRTCFQENGYGINIHNYKARILKYAKHKQGYLIVNLSKNSKAHTKQVHRLVAQAFISNAKCLLEVNHIDGNKQNNCVDNLEWCTRIQNQRHAEAHNLIKRNYGKENGMSKKVYYYDNKGNLLKEYETLTQAAKELAITIGSASFYALGKCKKPKYILKYEGND